MQGADLLVDGFERVRGLVKRAVVGLGVEQLTFRSDSDANTVAWLIWHLSRVQDDHVADAAGTDQVWLVDGWRSRFALPFDEGATGYGQSSAEVGAVTASAELLMGYHEAVCDRTVRYVATLTDPDFDRVVDHAWNPPVTLGVRLVSVLSDDLQHAGQAAFIRGVAERSMEDQAARTGAGG